MKYELYNARRLLGEGRFEITVRSIPERIPDYFRLSTEKKYHVRNNEWYTIPGYQRCPKNIETHLQPLYHQAEHLTSSHPAPDPLLTKLK